MTHSRDGRKVPGIKRPYLSLPDTLEGQQSYCVTVPGGLQNKLVLIDLLATAALWYNWERTEGTQAKQAADAWRDLLNLPELKMCCCPQPTNRRYNDAGELEVSYDNGATWVTDDSLDDRFSGTTAPPLSGADGAEKRCIGATSAQEYIKDNLIDSLTEGMTYAELNGVGVALAALLGVTGIGILIAAFAAAAFLAGIVAVQAAFTSDVWADFRCILYCNIRGDASFTAGGWEAVKEQILSTFTGVVSAVLYNWANSVGPVGLTNAARSGWAASGDCSSCDCAAPCAFPEDHFYYGEVDSVTDNGDGTITLEVHSTPAPDTTEAIRFWAEPHDSACCNILSFIITDPAPGSTPGWSYRDCDGNENTPSGFTPGCYQWHQYIQNFQLTTPFHAVIVFGSECP